MKTLELLCVTKCLCIMETKLDDIKHIRSMMERSSKFLSLSGMSGVSAGTFALIGAGLGHFIIQGEVTITGLCKIDLVIVAFLVLLFAGSAGLYFSMRKAKKTGAKFWMPVTQNIMIDAAIPMLAGGAFCIIALFQGYAGVVAPAMLIFYGLALIAASARTYSEIRIMGFCQIILGLLAGIFPRNGLLFWTLGFGVLHIVYGVLMYSKYDRIIDKKV